LSGTALFRMSRSAVSKTKSASGGMGGSEPEFPECPYAMDAGITSLLCSPMHMLHTHTHIAMSKARRQAWKEANMGFCFARGLRSGSTRLQDLSADIQAGSHPSRPCSHPLNPKKGCSKCQHGLVLFEGQCRVSWDTCLDDLAGAEQEFERGVWSPDGVELEPVGFQSADV